MGIRYIDFFPGENFIFCYTFNRICTYVSVNTLYVKQAFYTLIVEMFCLFVDVSISFSTQTSSITFEDFLVKYCNKLYIESEEYKVGNQKIITLQTCR